MPLREIWKRVFDLSFEFLDRVEDFTGVLFLTEEQTKRARAKLETMSPEELDRLKKSFEAVTMQNRILRLLYSGAKREQTIDRMPATVLTHVLQWLLPKKFFERVIEPTVADAHFEYISAVEAKQWGKARWIKLRIWLIVGWVLLKSPITLAIDAAVDRFSAK